MNEDEKVKNETLKLSGDMAAYRREYGRDKARARFKKIVSQEFERAKSEPINLTALFCAKEALE